MNHWAFCSDTGLPLLLLLLLLLFIDEDEAGKGGRSVSSPRAVLAATLIPNAADVDVDVDSGGGRGLSAVLCPSIPVLDPDTPPNGEKGLMRSGEGVLGGTREGSMAGPGRKRDVAADVDGVWVKEN